MESTADTIKKQGLNYDYYLQQCDALRQELEKGKTQKISPQYVEEKLRKIKSLLDDLN
jgi:hypothetical protein